MEVGGLNGNQIAPETDILKELINEHFSYKYKVNLPLRRESNQRSLLLDIKKSMKELDFLCEKSIEYEFYAHELIRPHDMEEVLRHLNSGVKSDDFATDNFFLMLENENWIAKISPDSTKLQDTTEINISFDIAREDFDLDKLVDEIKYRIVHRRHLLQRHGFNINFSNKEMELIARRNAPRGMKFLSQAQEEGRAVGLYCWDTITGIADKKYIPYKIDSPSLDPNHYPSFLSSFEERKTTDREFLFSMVDKNLLKGFHTGGTCQNPKESCIYDADGKKDMSSNINGRQCDWYDHCLRRLNNLIKHADLSVKKKQIIPIANSKWF